MKLYNPFKAHIVKTVNGFAIRKYQVLFGFRFLDVKINDWWWAPEKRYNGWFTIKTLAEANERLWFYKNNQTSKLEYDLDLVLDIKR